MRKSRAFTLIELLVVIAIIAILAAILFPVFAQAREKARTTLSSSNARQLALAINMYKQDYDEHFPFGGWLPNGIGTWEWQNSTAPYIKNKQLYRCPSTSDEDEAADPKAWAWNRNPVNYLYNNQLGRDRVPPSDARVNQPSTCWLIVDGHSDWGGQEGVDWMGRPRTIWLMEDTTFGNAASLINGWLSWQGFTWGLPRHNLGANVAFVDGHVKFQKVSPIAIGTDVARGNATFGAPGDRGWFEQTYPYNQVGMPGQDDPNWRWNTN